MSTSHFEQQIFIITLLLPKPVVRFADMAFALACLPLIPSIIAFYYVSNEEVHRTIAILLPIAIFGYFLTSSLIPVIGEYTKKRGLSGKDLGKKGTPNESRDMYVASLLF